MILRIVLVGALAVAGLVYVKQDRVLARVGIVGTCVRSFPVAGASAAERQEQWWSCSEGKVTGFPSLELTSCKSAGFLGKREIWSCEDWIADPS
jgi:hypothetical protein